MSELAAEFIRQNNWANLKLIALCEGLDEALLNASVPGTYGRLRDTLVHIVASQEFYIARLDEIRPPSWRIAEDQPWPGFARLKECAAEFGRRLETLAVEGRAGWRVDFDDNNWRTQASVILVQAVNHCVDHRSQIATILSQAGVEPAELDGWAWGEATERTVEA